MSKNSNVHSLWVARNKDYKLFIYAFKPERFESEFSPCSGAFAVARLWDNSFPEVTWENSPKELIIREE